MKQEISSHETSLLLYTLAVCVQTFMFVVFSSEIIQGGGSFLLTLFKYACDSCMLLLPFWLVRSRWRWTMLLPVMFVAVFCLVNLWYMRFWGDIMPFSSFNMIRNIDGLVLHSVKGLVAIRDLWLLSSAVLMAIAIIVWRTKLSRERSFSKRTKILAVCGTLALFLLSQAARTWSMSRWMGSDIRPQPTYADVTGLRLDASHMCPRTSFVNNGIIVHVGVGVVTFVKTRNVLRDLSETERAEVAGFLGKRPHFQSGKTLAANAGKNIIFIIVESLNADVIGRIVDGREITPILNSLLKQEGTVACLDVDCQIGDGGSSDGQLMYNAGLYPLSIGVAALTVVPDIELPALNSHLNRASSCAVFADNGNSWNQTLAFHKYGFDNVITNSAFLSDKEERGADAAMLGHSLKLIDTVRTPFFMELVTISMHVPFDDKGVRGFRWINEAGKLGRVEANYLRMTAYFDYELGKFIDGLKAKRIYDNTLLIIASDHSWEINTASHREGDDGRYGRNTPVVFIAANTGVTRRIERRVGQIDVYPTILELAGVDDAAFRGLGVSMLDTISSSFNEREVAQKVSDLILRGNYFGNK